MAEARALPPASLLQLIWLASPALPVGGFSYSEGVEAAVEHGLITDEHTARGWLLDQLHLSLARSDLPALAQAIEAWRAGNEARVHDINQWLLHTRESSELRAQTEQMGRSLLDWLRNQAVAESGSAATAEQLDACARLQPAWPVAFALAAAGTQADTRDCLLAFGFGWAENMAAAAIKAVPLGQSAGQRILARLAGELPAAVNAALQCTDDERQAYAPMLAILSAQHEAQYSRLFRS